MKFFNEIFEGIIAPVEDNANEMFDKTVFIYLDDEQNIMFKKCDSNIFRPILNNCDHFHIVDTGKFFKVICSSRVSMDIIQRLAWQCNIMII